MKATKEDAFSSIRTLVSLGHQAYLAGGCVRDLLLGLTPNDYDVTTSATPDIIQKAFPKTIPVGASFGVVKVVFGDNRELDIATFRSDGKYSDNRRPDTVEFITSAEEDVKRRDFTINGMLMLPSGTIVDHVNGQEDLKNKVLRAIGNPNDRFQEDALRMIRAIRFATRFKMDIETETWNALVNNKLSIRTISKERITEELTKIATNGKCDKAFFLLCKSGLFDTYFDVCKISNESRWRALYSLSEMQEGDSLVTFLFLILKDTSYYYWERFTNSLTLTNDQKAELEAIQVDYREMIHFLYQTQSKQRKLMYSELKETLLKLIAYHRHIPEAGFAIRSNDSLLTLESKMKEIEALGWPADLITGKDLISMGFIPGPLFSPILEEIRNAQLDSVITQYSEVRPYIIKLYPNIPYMDNGVLIDHTLPKTLLAPCGCGKVMRLNIRRNEKGILLWDNATDKININGISSKFVFSTCCYSKKGKKSFQEAKL